jgi:hypothetical protein
MADLGFRAFDADHHYYEAEDAFLRHVDPRLRSRAMQWAVIKTGASPTRAASTVRPTSRCSTWTPPSPSSTGRSGRARA